MLRQRATVLARPWLQTVRQASGLSESLAAWRTKVTKELKGKDPEALVTHTGDVSPGIAECMPKQRITQRPLTPAPACLHRAFV
jgi:hypothetical protein